MNKLLPGQLAFAEPIEADSNKKPATYRIARRYSMLEVVPIITTTVVRTVTFDNVLTYNFVVSFGTE